MAESQTRQFDILTLTPPPVLNVDDVVYIMKEDIQEPATLALVSLTDTCWGPQYGYCGHTHQCVQHASISEKWSGVAQKQASLKVLKSGGPEPWRQI